MIGRTLGGYQITEQIGMGGMATVYKAFDPKTERYVAIKTLPQQYSKDETFIARFEREARAIARLEHIHILPVFAYGEEDGITYMVMRLMETGTLSDLIKSEPLSIQDISRLIGQIAEALDYAHSQNIIHRDIKPSNVLIDQQGNAYLTDFGIAKIVEEGLPDLTGTGIVGTPQYMSPEQCLSQQELAATTDQYSLGVILYEMVTGQTPYHAETPMAILQKQLLAEPLPPPRSIKPDLPEDIEMVILKALARDPASRFESCGAMSKALKDAIDGQTLDIHIRDEPATVFGIQSKDYTPLPDDATALLDHPQPIAQKPDRPSWTYAIIGLVIIGVLIIGAAASGILAPQEDAESTSVAVMESATSTTTESSTMTHTPTPIPTDTPTQDVIAMVQATNAMEATINAARTQVYMQDMTATATLWTATPEPSAPPTARDLADIPVRNVIFFRDFESNSNLTNSLNVTYTRESRPESLTHSAVDKHYEIDMQTKQDFVQINFPLVTHSSASILEADVLISSESRGGFGINIGMNNPVYSAYFHFGKFDDTDLTMTIDLSIDSQEADAATEPIAIDYDRWYHLRVEIDPITAAYIFYLDGEFYHTITPEVAEDVLNAGYDNSIAIWNFEYAKSVHYLDNIKVTKAE